MRRTLLTLAWLILGVYSAVAAIGGSQACAWLTMVCGFMVGFNVAQGASQEVGK